MSDEFQYLREFGVDKDVSGWVFKALDRMMKLCAHPVLALDD